MNAVRNIQENPSLASADLLGRICQVLQPLGVTFFAYTATDKAGNAYCLGSKADYAEQYLLQEHARDDVHQEGVGQKARNIFWDYCQLDESAEKLYRFAAQFNQGHTLTVIQPAKEMTHCYHFSGELSNHRLNETYLQHWDTLSLFIDYFNDCLKHYSEIAEVYQQPIQIGRQSREILLAKKIIESDPSQIDLRLDAIHPIQFKRFNEYCLNKPERRCLYWMHQGKSYEMIAAILHVSRKTIERHVDSIKRKYHCYTLFQLGEKVGEQGDARLLTQMQNLMSGDR